MLLGSDTVGRVGSNRYPIPPMVGSTYSTCACAVVSHAPQTIMPIPSILMYAVILFSPPAECPRPPALRECSGGSGKVTCRQRGPVRHQACPSQAVRRDWSRCLRQSRSEEHTSELQSLRHLVCRL